MKELALLLLVFVLPAPGAAEEYIHSPAGREAYYDPYNQAVAAHLASRLPEAVRLYALAAEEALKLPQGRWEHARAVTLLAVAQHTGRDYKAAEKNYLASLAYCRKHKLQMGSLAQSGLGRLYLDQNQPEKAGPLLKEACEQEYREIGKTTDPYGLAASISDLGRLYERLGNRQKAELYYLTAVKLFQDAPTSFAFKVLDAEQMDSYPIILYRAGQFYRGGDDPAAAGPYYERALKAFENWTGLNDRPALKARVLEYRGRTLRALGRGAEGAADLKEASALYKQVSAAQRRKP